MSSSAASASAAPPAKDTSLNVGAAGWNRVAEGYAAEATAITGPAALRLLDLVCTRLEDPLRAGEQPKAALADIACGSGVVALAAASQRRDLFSSILASDFSDNMCSIVAREYAAMNASSPGTSPLVPLRTVVADAQKMSEIESNTMDVTVSTFGVMLIPSPSAAVSEMARITKPGGLVGITTWCAPSHSQYHCIRSAVNRQIAAKKAEKVDAASNGASTSPSSAAPLTTAQTMQLPLNSVDAVRTMLEQQGLQIDAIETYTGLSRQYHGVADFWDSISAAIPTLEPSEENLRWAKEYLSGIFGEHATFQVSMTAIVALAKKPQ